jgi:hypothetical protein
MRDLEQATITETIYLRKWHDGEREAGALPYEIVVIETVSEPDVEPVTTVRIVPEELLAEFNDRADSLEQEAALASSEQRKAEITQLEIEVSELSRVVEKWEQVAARKRDPEYPKLLMYRERLARAQEALVQAQRR